MLNNDIQYNISLQPFNTFGISAVANQLISIKQVSKLQQLISNKILIDKPVFILGGGSNILLKNNFQGIVLKMDILGKNVVQENENHVWVKVGGGENWHEFVLWTLANNYFGIENLSLIPGTVGASPIQNIGAYGVELKDVFHELEAINLQTGQSATFSHQACQFGYRNSIFKNEIKGQFCITSVVFKLSKMPQLHIKYGAIRRELEATNVSENQWTPKMVSDIVIAIRSSKLPDPAQIGNSGSFFKNPEIPLAQFKALQKKFSNIVFYELPNDMIKVPAGWLIEQCGWKGKRIGNTGTYKNQALVLVNHGNATGAEIYQLSSDILESVQQKFGITLSREVNIIE